MLEEENNKISFHWETCFIFMQIAFIVLLLQHSHHEHTLHTCYCLGEPNGLVVNLNLIYVLSSVGSAIHFGVPRRTCGDKAEAFDSSRQDCEDKIYRSRVI